MKAKSLVFADLYLGGLARNFSRNGEFGDFMHAKIGLAFVALSLAAGCASITRGTTNEVSFTSSPAEAVVSTSTGQSCTTPCQMIFPRRGDFTATFTSGGDERVIEVVSDIAAAGVGAAVGGNLIFGGPIGAGIDVATGAGLDHFPDPVHADFSKPQSEQIQGTTAVSASNSAS